MALAHRNTQSATGTTSFTVTKPTGTVDGDLLVAACYFAGGGGANPGGWTASETVFVPTGGRLSSFWKIASGEGANYTFSGTSGGLALVMCFSGPDQNISLDASSQNTDTTGTSLTALAVTNTYGNDVQVFLTGVKLSAGIPSVTPPTGMTEPTNGDVNSGGTSCIEAAYFISSSGATGSTGNRVGTASAAVTGYAAFLLTFLPFQHVLPAAATASASALGPVISSIDKPPLATASASAQGPAVQVLTEAGFGSASGTSLAPTMRTIEQPPLATATAAAQGPSVQERIAPALNTASAAALNPTMRAVVESGLGLANGAAFSPLLQSIIKPSFGLASASALNPVPRIIIESGFGSATAIALIPDIQGLTLNTPLLIPLATATATALSATNLAIARPPLATATAAALTPTMRAVIEAAIATASASAQSATVQFRFGVPLNTASASAATPTLRMVIESALAAASASGLTVSLLHKFFPPTAGASATAVNANLALVLEMLAAQAIADSPAAATRVIFTIPVSTANATAGFPPHLQLKLSLDVGQAIADSFDPRLIIPQRFVFRGDVWLAPAFSLDVALEPVESIITPSFAQTARMDLSFVRAGVALDADLAPLSTMDLVLEGV